MAADVHVEQRAAPLVIEPTPGLEVHDAQRRHPRFVGGMIEQSIDLVEGEIGVCLGRGEQVAHPHSDRLVVGRQPRAGP